MSGRNRSSVNASCREYFSMSIPFIDISIWSAECMKDIAERENVFFLKGLWIKGNSTPLHTAFKLISLLAKLYCSPVAVRNNETDMFKSAINFCASRESSRRSCLEIISGLSFAMKS